MAGVLRVVRRDVSGDVGGDVLISEINLNEGEDVELDSEKVKNREEDETETITNLIVRIVPAKEQTRAQRATGKADAEQPDEYEPTKEELLERARELEIEGRSSMSKDELTKAIAKAEKADSKNAAADEDEGRNWNPLRDRKK